MSHKQASKEERAKNVNAGVQGANAMGALAGASRSKPASSASAPSCTDGAWCHCKCALFVGRSMRFLQPLATPGTPDSADAPKLIHNQLSGDSGRGLFMMEAVPEWLARASNCAR